MNPDVLRSNEVLPIRNIRWNRELNSILLPGTPVGLVASGAAETRLPDFEPVAAAIVARDVAIWSLFQLEIGINERRDVFIGLPSSYK